MPLLTKKFTRDSLKRASSSGTGINVENDGLSEDEIIRREMVRARTKSMKSRNVLNQQQRRHRSLSRGPTSPYRSFGLEKVKAKINSDGPNLPNLAHPNDEYSQAYNEAELLTQMSSLTEPTWAPSIVGGSDMNSTHHRRRHQNQLSRTGNYSNVRNQTQFQHKTPRVQRNRATITISSAKDLKETKVLVLESREKEKVNANKSNSNHGHHERAGVGTEGIKVNHNVEQDERDDKTALVESDVLSSNIASRDLRDGTPDCNSDRKTKHSSPRRRSRTRGEDECMDGSKRRGRSSRPSRNRNQNLKKRSSSISSKRSTKSSMSSSTAPTVSKYSSTSSSLSQSVSSRKLQTDTQAIARRRKEKSSPILRSSSVPPFTSNSKRNQRTSSVPPPIFKSSESQRHMINHGNNGVDNNDVVVAHINQYGDKCKNEQKPKADSQFSNTMEMISNIASKTADTSSISSQSKCHPSVSFATSSHSSELLPSTPSSAVEAARKSLRPRLRRVNSNRSISSAQSESIILTASNGRAISTKKVLNKIQTSPSVTPTSPLKNNYTSRTHKLALDVRAKKIHEQRQQRRCELELEQQRRLHKDNDKERQKEAIEAASGIKREGEEPQYTTASTLLYDFLVYCLLLLLTLPHRVLLFLWSRTFSRKWTARGKNILVTNASSALGLETARQFATEGANLILVSHSTTASENNLNWVVKECHELGSGKIKSYSTNLANPRSTELTLRQAAKDFDDKFDVVILNGENKSHGCLFEEIVDVHQIERMVSENTLSCIISLHYLLKNIPKTSDSRIVILSSTSGIVASPYKSVYSATQHALKGFCDSLRMELNDTHTERRAPKICFASFPDLVGQDIHHRDTLDPRTSRMGADIAPMKTHSWAGIPLQQAVHDLIEAISFGQRNFGAPHYINAWRFFQVVAPGLVDFSIFRHFRKTQYRPA